jgi:hypothetical protein
VRAGSQEIIPGVRNKKRMREGKLFYGWYSSGAGFSLRVLNLARTKTAQAEAYAT